MYSVMASITSRTSGCVEALWPRPRARPLKNVAHAQLNTPRIERRGEPERLARSISAVAVEAAVPLHDIADITTTRSPNGESGAARNRIIHARKIQMVEQIESLNHKLQGLVLLYRKTTRQPRVGGPETRPQADVPARKVGPVCGVVPIVIQLGARQNVEGTPAVVPVDRSELESAKEFAGGAGAVRRLQDRVSHHLMS